MIVVFAHLLWHPLWLLLTLAWNVFVPAFALLWVVRVIQYPNEYFMLWWTWIGFTIVSRVGNSIWRTQQVGCNVSPRHHLNFFVHDRFKVQPWTGPPSEGPQVHALTQKQCQSYNCSKHDLNDLASTDCQNQKSKNPDHLEQLPNISISHQAYKQWTGREKLNKSIQRKNWFPNNSTRSKKTQIRKKNARKKYHPSRS